MKRSFTELLLFMVMTVPAVAQSESPCSDRTDSDPSAIGVTSISAERYLKSAGFGSNREVLLVALRDPRPTIRSAAAQELSDRRSKTDVEPLIQAWSAETDRCAKGNIEYSLTRLVGDLAWDPAQHPADQEWVTPFQPCKSPPSPLVTVDIKQETSQDGPGTVVRVAIRNQTPLPIPFALARNPQMLFSVTVTNPTGANAKISKGLEPMYQPSRRLGLAHSPYGRILMPGEDQVWLWRVGDDFDMASPGLYHVSLGGPIAYLNTTVCSNSADVRVE